MATAIPTARRALDIRSQFLIFDSMLFQKGALPSRTGISLPEIPWNIADEKLGELWKIVTAKLGSGNSFPALGIVFSTNYAKFSLSLGATTFASASG
jgi:hypothetical protein